MVCFAVTIRRHSCVVLKIAAVQKDNIQLKGIKYSCLTDQCLKLNQQSLNGVIGKTFHKFNT